MLALLPKLIADKDKTGQFLLFEDSVLPRRSGNAKPRRTNKMIFVVKPQLIADKNKFRQLVLFRDLGFPHQPGKCETMATEDKRLNIMLLANHPELLVRLIEFGRTMDDNPEPDVPDEEYDCGWRPLY